MILHRDKQPYILEIANYGPDKSGVLFTPVSEFIEWNSDRLVGYRPYLGKTFPTRQLEREVEVSKSAVPDMNLINWLKTLIKRQHYPRVKSEYYCSEYICYLLQQIGVLRSTYLADGYKPWELLYGVLDLMPMHTYGPGVTVIWN